jgi:protein-tyrosine kinase
MSSLIEQAAKRLQELRRAGIDIPPVEHFGNSRFDPDAISEPVVAPVRGATPVRPMPARDNPACAMPERAASSPAAQPVPLPDGTEVMVVPAEVPRVAPEPRRHQDIDLARLASMGYLVPTNAQSLLADLLRVIKRPLLQNMRRSPEMGGPSQRSNVIVVTSAVPGEGKTFVATNLAMSIAMEVDHAAVLIDGDVLRPSVFNRFDLVPQTGLMDVLVNAQIRATDLMVGTNVPKLTLLSAGTAQDRAEELLASTAMDLLLDELSELYHDRVIIIDSPPLLVTTESRALAERGGQVVLVVEADSTPRDQIARAFDTLANCPIVLSVLNRSRAIESDYVYGY